MIPGTLSLFQGLEVFQGCLKLATGPLVISYHRMLFRMFLVHRMCTKSIGFLEWARNCGDQADFEVEGMNHKKMVTKHFDLPNCLKHLYLSQRTKQLKNSKVRLTSLLGGV